MHSRGQRLLTLATLKDWTPVLTALESSLFLKYVRSGAFDRATPDDYFNFAEIPGLGKATAGDAAREPRYLIMLRDTPVVSRTVLLNNGKSHYVTDHENNPDSVIFSAGGVFSGRSAVIQGEVAKLSRTEQANEIFRRINSLIKSHFHRINAFYVGADALALGTAGYRLTANVTSPVSYDLEVKPARPS